MFLFAHSRNAITGTVAAAALISVTLVASLFTHSRDAVTDRQVGGGGAAQATPAAQTAPVSIRSFARCGR